MRSPSFTFLLVVVTSLVLGLAAVRFSQGNLNSLFGEVIKEGDQLYQFDVKKVRRIRLAGNGVKAECVFENGQWQMVSPWKDRMDPRFSDAILRFTLGAKVVDAFPSSKLTSDQTGFVDGTFEIRIEGENGEALAKYGLVRRSAYRYYDEKDGSETATILVEPHDKNRKGYTYACTGDIYGAFKDGFRFLRDHHPLYFNRLALQTIRIKNAEGELVLSHTAPDTLTPEGKIQATPWNIVKPLELRTDPAAVNALLGNLFNLQAKRINNRAEVTLPPAEAGKGETIAIRHFGETQETILEISPPASQDADTVHATVSNRPDAVFELLRKPLGGDSTAPGATGEDLVTLASIPDTVNELRDQALTNLNGAALGGILISPSTGQPIALVRNTPPPGSATADAGFTGFSVIIDNAQQRPNVYALARMIGTITKTRVAGFVTDAATDLSPYGLDHPALRLKFVAAQGDDWFELAFGQGRDGTWYSNRSDSTHGITPSVKKVDDSFIANIPVHPWDWKDTYLWSISPVDVKGVTRQIGDGPELNLGWNFITETWSAQEGSKDRSQEINRAVAGHFLDGLVNLRAASWIDPQDEDAQRALQTPLVRLKILVQTVDQEGNAAPPVTRRLDISPAPATRYNHQFYARIDGYSDPFLLDESSVRPLGANLFGDQ